MWIVLIKYSATDLRQFSRYKTTVEKRGKQHGGSKAWRRITRDSFLSIDQISAMGDSLSQLRDVTRLQQSLRATACNRFLHLRGGYVGSIIRRYRILGRITHLSDTLPTLTEDNRPPYEGTDLPVELLAESRRWGVHRPRSSRRDRLSR